MRLLLAFALFVTAFAGCSDAPAGSAVADPPDAPGSQDAVAAAPAATTLEWGIQYGAGAGGYAVRPSGESVAFFDVPAGTARLVVDSSWTCASGPACAVRVVLMDGDNPAAEGTGMDHLQIVVESPGAGEWRVIVYPGGDGSVVLQASGASVVTAMPS